MTVASGVDDRLRTARLAVRVDADEPDVAGLAGELFAGGVNLLHLDRTGADPGGELTVLRAARAAAHAHQGLLSTGPAPVLGDGFRPDVLQLDGSDGPAASVRQQAHPWARIGRSTENATELARAAGDPDVDHLWVGVELELDLELVRAAAALLPPQESAGKPWFALGASDQKSLEDALAAGARRVLVGRSLTASDDPRAAARRIRTRLNQAWRDDPAMAGTGLALGGTPRPLRPRGG